MTLHFVDIVIQVIVFLFAISVHESAHAWTAWRRGDPTAYMLGRVTLNPIRHIDPIGTVILPAIAMITGFPVIGWAKPTPVNTRNFKNLVLDDILTSVAGPISNFLIASLSVTLLVIIITLIPGGRAATYNAMAFKFSSDLPLPTNSPLVPVALLLYNAMFINVLLGVFNLIPIPPLDGSHVLRHFLSDGARQIYDRMGMIGLVLLMFFGGNFLGRLIFPIIDAFNILLMKV